MARRRSEPVTFRLEESLFRELEAEATRREMSPGLLARELVVGGLARTHDAERGDDIARLQADLLKTREAIATAAAAMLARGEPWTAERAIEWAKKTLLA